MGTIEDMSQTTGAEVDANRANWDERVATHWDAYDADGFATDPARITSVVRYDLGLMAPHLPTPRVADKPMEGRSLLHLQCHIGTDTLSWARLGATVTGLDFSPASITAARSLAARADLSATFVEADVLAASAALGGEAFDVVYTSIGVLPWLADLPAWARAVATVLRPGGLFFIRDSHPVLNAMDSDDPDTAAGKLVITQPYFATGVPLRYDNDTTYADPNARLSTSITTYEWQHSLAEVVQSLLDAGLRLTSISEHATIPWQALPQMTQTETGYALPHGRERLPVTFSLTAQHADS